MNATAEQAAANLLKFIWTDSNGDVPLPVDPARIAFDLGVQVFEANLSENISGSLVKTAGVDPVILLNRSDSNKRQRFSCAHELGHFVRHSGDEAYEYVEQRGPLAAEGRNSEEIYANLAIPTTAVSPDEPGR